MHQPAWPRSIALLANLQIPPKWHLSTRFARPNLLLGAFLFFLGAHYVRSQEAELAPNAELGPNQEQVGRSSSDGVVLPVNQRLTPYGIHIELPGLRPQVLAISPKGHTVVTSGKTNELLVLDPADGKIRQRVVFPGDSADETIPEAPSDNVLKPDTEGQVSYTGLVFSPDGQRIYLSNVNGSIKVFRVDENGFVTALRGIVLPPANAPRRRDEIPSGLAISPDGTRLYVCGNLSNRLFEMDTKSGKILRTIDVGAVPYDVVLAHGKAFVSNWAGRRPGPGDTKGPAGRGTEVRVDPVRYIASEGSVSIVDLTSGEVAQEILVGLHASGLCVSPDSKFLICANAGDDTLSVIDMAKEVVIETIWAKSKPSDLFGASPNSVTFESTGKKLLVANGSQNAVAVIRFRPGSERGSTLEGLIPVGWFPGAIAWDAARSQFCVANIKGLPSTAKEKGDGAGGFNSHQYQGSLTFAKVPDGEELAALSERVARNQRYESITRAALPPRPDQPPRPIPQRIGEPSPIKHVVYVIKENRTYDQILGDHPQGNGKPELCVFGKEVTPNLHKLVQEFMLLDNTYCAGILSADGHQWSTTAFSTDYMEKSFAGFPRSYPDGMGEDEADALAYSPAGFLWDNAFAHNVSIRNYGEFMIPKVRWRDTNKKGSPDFKACWRRWKGDADDVILESEPAVESIRPISPSEYVGWEMSVPDQYRADFVIRELKEFEARGTLPQLLIICLPNDHTSGTSPGCPTPAACVADNDLAFGRIVEALSHSRFWNEMAIFAIEDDPQAGWDHVSGYRTTAFCISPFAKRGGVVSTQYNTTSILRTIEQILGMPPMNQFDASATPMFDCFVEQPNLLSYDSVPNQIPLDQMNPEANSLRDPILRKDAVVSASLNFREVDRAPEDVLNRILWRAMRGSSDPYPAQCAGVEEDEDEDED